MPQRRESVSVLKSQIPLQPRKTRFTLKVPQSFHSRSKRTHTPVLRQSPVNTPVGGGVRGTKVAPKVGAWGILEPKASWLEVISVERQVLKSSNSCSPQTTMYLELGIPVTGAGWTLPWWDGQN